MQDQFRHGNQSDQDSPDTLWLMRGKNIIQYGVTPGAKPCLCSRRPNVPWGFVYRQLVDLGERGRHCGYFTEKWRTLAHGRRRQRFKTGVIPFNAPMFPAT